MITFSASLVTKSNKLTDEKLDILRKVTIGVSLFTIVVLGSLGITTLGMYCLIIIYANLNSDLISMSCLILCFLSVVGIRQNSSAAFAFSVSTEIIPHKFLWRSCLVMIIYVVSFWICKLQLDALLDCMSSAVVIWRYSGGGSSLYSPKKEKMWVSGRVALEHTSCKSYHCSIDHVTCSLQWYLRPRQSLHTVICFNRWTFSWYYNKANSPRSCECPKVSCV